MSNIFNIETKKGIFLKNIWMRKKHNTVVLYNNIELYNCIYVSL